MEKILVAGATGATGNKIIHLLKESQYFEPVAMVRSEHQKAKFNAMGVGTLHKDLTRSLEGTTAGIDKLIFAAGSGGKNLEEVDKNGAIKLIDNAAKHKVKKFVMLSSMGADHPEQVKELQDYLEAKQAADQHLRDSGLNYTIVRPGSLTEEPGTKHVMLDAKLRKQGEISRADVAHTLVSVLFDNTANQATFEIVKGETLIGEALEQFESVEEYERI
ncbi:SDR family oxidoreductase [Nonlabens xiamenensis]|uniref:SDR family oxidoreductase n=1 Tax=Nonlabens xiamenensis TaxID=2341043 RepID=UPI000F615836|nr:SDR family oxidoreductase [Nonlabens xiamenensis]